MVLRDYGKPGGTPTLIACRAQCRSHSHDRRLSLGKFLAEV
jgi:hypothetical protein